jgi:hypothetical protein
MGREEERKVDQGQTPRWEYKVLSNVTDHPQAEDALDGLGAAGWELVAIEALAPDDRRYIFKRALTSPTAEPEPELDAAEERWLRNVSAAQALAVLPEEKQDEVLCAILSEDERQCETPPDDFHERVMRYFAERRDES